jgi:hypothetical protein
MNAIGDNTMGRRGSADVMLTTESGKYLGLPSFSIPHAMLAVALVGVPQEDEAKAEARSALKLDPTFTTGNWAVTVGQVPYVFGPIAEALRKAGIS